MRRRDFLKGSLIAGVSATVAGASCSSGPATGGLRASTESGLIHPLDLRCESRRDPLGVDSQRPRLSWKLRAPGGVRSQAQSAYRITVSSSEALLRSGVADLWDSGKVHSARQLHVEYDGPLPASGQRLFWRVQVWNKSGVPSPPSEIAWWEM